MRRRQENLPKPDDTVDYLPTERRASGRGFEPEEESFAGPEHVPWHEFDDASELDEIDLSDERWEAFLADEDELDPEPDPDDFYTFE